MTVLSSISKDVIYDFILFFFYVIFGTITYGTAEIIYIICWLKSLSFLFFASLPEIKEIV